MDRNIIAIGHVYADQEAAIAVACYSAAAERDLSNMQADSCEDGSLACPTCPFKDQVNRIECNLNENTK